MVRSQVAGLEWIHRNIAAFGGDPGRVTIFGVSAGGDAVAHMSISPAAEGLFHGAIFQSANITVSQRHLAHCFSAVSRPFSAVFPPFLCAVRLPGAETERTGEKWRKMGEIWGRNGRETAVAEWRWGQLLEVAGLPPPPQRLHGASLLPLLHDPARLAHKANASFSQYPRQVDGRSYMGMTMRTADWRFTEWCGFNYSRAYPVWDEADAFGCQLELYPHEGDDGKNMDLFENVPLRQTFLLILSPFRSTDLFVWSR